MSSKNQKATTAAPKKAAKKTIKKETASVEMAPPENAAETTVPVEMTPPKKAAIPAPPTAPQMSEAEREAELARLKNILKDAVARAAAAKNAAAHGLVTSDVADTLTAEATAARLALKAMGGRVGGTGGRFKGQMSGLDAAFRVLSESDKPLNSKGITTAAIEAGYWAPEGLTPDMTLSAALQREVSIKGDASRFIKVDKGMYTVRAAQ